MTFRLAVGFAAILAGTMLVAFALIYWQITIYELIRADRVLVSEATVLAALPPDELDERLKFLKNDDFHFVIKAAGLFDGAHNHIAGNIKTWPMSLTSNEKIKVISGGPFDIDMRAIAKALPDGRTLVLARSLRDLQDLRAIAFRALETCALPALVFSLLGGFWLSGRALRRVGIMHQAIEQIMDGNLRGRLPVNGDTDEMERLAGSVNRMVDRIEHLLEESKAVGDNIAHDLRTPLTRVRTRLERSRRADRSVEVLKSVIDRTIVDLDQCFDVVTALLRIGEIESGRRREAFDSVDLDAIAANVFDLFEPLAEDKQMVLRLMIEPPDPNFGHLIHGDSSLLNEALANLVDNALKFTPNGGTVSLGVGVASDRLFLQVSDTGPGIVAGERAAVLKRFYRSDKSRHLPGNGLGLSLVSAITQLHAGVLIVEDAGPGTIFQLSFPPLEGHGSSVGAGRHGTRMHEAPCPLD